MRHATLFHATNKKGAEAVLDEKFVPHKISPARMLSRDSSTDKFYSQEVGSLGRGLYAFLDDKELAKLFWNKNNNSDECQIIKIDIKFDEDNSLNFVDNLDDIAMFRTFLSNEKVQKIIKKFSEVYKNKYSQHELDGILIEYYINYFLIKKKIVTSIDCVFCATSTKLYKEFYTYVPNGIEYCIRSNSIISGKELI
ncbi:hypothetical protein DS831_06125 [Bombilactobacillus bombi]|uniref:DUF3990 domain-containing protein n=1 Tax=Bombilactobacillus bombi TaxID=1303590 RepID=A0A3R6V8R9_9LACO|nr:hypothetical protein [Bombilactobacillus bombi]RHW49737.1 hypothetical protein DS831_06125 [Bombilactobacillus bombi]